MNEAIPEHIKARLWRERKNLTVRQLSEKIGFSVASIRRFEQGFHYGRVHGTRVPIDGYSWQRYRLVCAAVEHEADNFDWGETE